MLTFDTATMRRIFDAAVDRASASDFWLQAGPTPPLREDVRRTKALEPG
jgi:hypothetical protein